MSLEHQFEAVDLVPAHLGCRGYSSRSKSDSPTDLSRARTRLFAREQGWSQMGHDFTTPSELYSPEKWVPLPQRADVGVTPSAKQGKLVGRVEAICRPLKGPKPWNTGPGPRLTEGHRDYTWTLEFIPARDRLPLHRRFAPPPSDEVAGVPTG